MAAFDSPSGHRNSHETLFAPNGERISVKSCCFSRNNSIRRCLIIVRYIIMADGKGSRWHNYKSLDKHSIRFDGETMLERTVRLLRERDGGCEIYITSHNPNVRVVGATRHEPIANVLEIDRFTQELICDDCCFLYGDVFYTDAAMDAVVGTEPDGAMLFFGSRESIFAIRVRDGAAFSACVQAVREAFLAGRVEECKGWQVYHQFIGLPLDGRAVGSNFIISNDITRDFNSPEDYESFLCRTERQAGKENGSCH